jgi:hypothetical protein
VVLRAMLRWIANGSRYGPFGYLITRYEENAQSKRAEKWHVHTEHLVSHLRDGTHYEETTRDGSVKIRTPPAQATRISVILDQQEPEIDLRQTPEIQSQQPKELAGEDSPPASDPSTDG